MPGAMPAPAPLPALCDAPVSFATANFCSLSLHSASNLTGAPMMSALPSSILVRWQKRSPLPSSAAMKPKPLSSFQDFTVPVRLSIWPPTTGAGAGAGAAVAANAVRPPPEKPPGRAPGRVAGWNGAAVARPGTPTPAPGSKAPNRAARSGAAAGAVAGAAASVQSAKPPAPRAARPGAAAGAKAGAAAAAGRSHTVWPVLAWWK
mmetsp:Transcript_93921/g.242675  ORF Transcript_93921/g.242675 Transcript_93921/m.242675 type:complete len:205 (-) Transcript_93921:168-782(-)